MKLNKFFLVAIALFLSCTLFAQDLISVKDLAKNLKNKDYVVVCATTKDNYRVHITGSINFPHNSLCVNEPVRGLIKSPAEMAADLGAAGITTDKTIVLYDEGSGKYSGRMYWVLKYLGHPNVKVLNGNMKAWKAGRKPITGAPGKAAKGTFAAKPDAAQLATMDEVKKAVGNGSYVIVDARTPEEFAGTAETELRKGHIPSAVNVNYETLMDAKGLLKSNDQLKSLFESKGVTSDKTVIAYCESSVRAGIVYFALKGLGYPNVKVYDGAYLEWQATSSNKVE